jgi:hypothetical protein
VSRPRAERDPDRTSHRCHVDERDQLPAPLGFGGLSRGRRGTDLPQHRLEFPLDGLVTYRENAYRLPVLALDALHVG